MNSSWDNCPQLSASSAPAQSMWTQLRPSHPWDTPFVLKHEPEQTRPLCRNCAHPVTPQNPVASPGQTSKRDIRKGFVTWPPSRKYFAFPFLALLMRQTKEYPQKSCGEGEMPENESAKLRHCSLQPGVLGRAQHVLHQHGNWVHLPGKHPRTPAE